MMRRLLFIAVCLVCTSYVNAQYGYIYLHNKALDESSSVNFNFLVTGTSTPLTYTLNDQPGLVNSVRDLGATNSGLYAITNAGTTGDGAVYYREGGSSTWQHLSSLAATAIDGGPGNTNVHCNAKGEVYYYDGHNAIDLQTRDAFDVALDRSTGSTRGNLFYIGAFNNVFIYNINNIGNSNKEPYRIGITADRIDVAPNGAVVFVSHFSKTVAITTGEISDFNTSSRSLGNPNGTDDFTITDVAVGDDGVIYAIDGAEGTVYRYNGGYEAGGTWTPEPTSRGITKLTGGPGGQIWGTLGGLSGIPPTIWSRMSNGTWYDDERVRTTANDNSVLIPVAAGSYNIIALPVTNWDLQAVSITDPTGNAFGSVQNRQAIVNVAGGEVVHVTFQQGLVRPLAAINTCSGFTVNEDFGSGAANTFGTPLVGQTSYHFQAGGKIQDGYYTVAGNASQAYSGIFGDYKDHTSGDGTGRMLIVNASYEQNEFYRRRITGLTPGGQYTLSAWVMSLDNYDVKPNVKFEVSNPGTQTLLESSITGNINDQGIWHQYRFSFMATQSAVDVVLRNNNTGGSGNDLAIDDITFSTSCDKGDAPASYGTLMADNGPAHIVSTLLKLGAGEDDEDDGKPSEDADLDKFDDGVATIPVLSNDGRMDQVVATYPLTVTYTNNTGTNANLVAWIDFNGNGLFDTNEGLGFSVPSGGSGSHTFTWTNMQLNGTNGRTGTYARFRISTDALSPSTPFGVASNGEVEDYFIPFATTLPVTLASFNASRQGATAVLSWKTLSEQGSAYFDVERSAGGNSFTALSRVKAAGTGSIEKAYSYTDALPLRGANYYRLKMTDKDGTVKYSAVQQLTFGTGNISLYPNPAHTSLTITGLSRGQRVNIVNMQGQQVSQYLASGSTLNLRINAWPAGIYQAHVLGPDGQLITTLKLVKY